jgi:hypothetical protein
MMQTIQRTYITNLGGELLLTFPAKFEVCHRCEGRGKYVNPNVDGHGIPQEEFDNDPDFREDYFAGVYDVQCSVCQGLRVVPVFDEDRATARQKAKYAMVEAQEERAHIEDAADRRTRFMESGGYDY